jgi:hypothetical protein
MIAEQLRSHQKLLTHGYEGVAMQLEPIIQQVKALENNHIDIDKLITEIESFKMPEPPYSSNKRMYNEALSTAICVIRKHFRASGEGRGAI